MCEASKAMREVRDAARDLSAACLARIPVDILRDEGTLRYLISAPADFDELLARIK